jgi:GPH family glycoside/pentoside/hexuronide:cation symporter
MSEKEMSIEEPGNLKRAIFYSFGQIGDATAYQSFIFLIFTFYFSVVQINMLLITIGFIIWSIWNAFNDPMIGYLSDRTHTKWGRRIPYIAAFFVPLAIVTFLLYTPILPIGEANQIGNFIYFLIIIIVFELCYTAFSLNLTSLFPEVFQSQKSRTQANNVRQVFTIVGLIFAFILPGLIITNYIDPANLPQYQVFGIIAGIIIVVTILLFLTLGPRERPEFKNDYKSAFGFFNTIKYCLKSKSFRFYIIAETANWFVYGMLPTIVPLYAFYVLGVEGFFTSLLLGIAFLSATLFMTFLWRPVVRRIGNRKSWMISMTIWIVGLLPLMFIDNFIWGVIVFFCIGIGLSGSLFIIDLVVADIVDEDETVTGMRREAGYYGVNAFILRFSNILVILAISTVFSTNGWYIFHPVPSPQIIFGLRSLIFIFPAIAIAIGILAIYFYPLHGARLRQVKEKLAEIHEQKKSRM